MAGAHPIHLVSSEAVVRGLRAQEMKVREEKKDCEVNHEQRKRRVERDACCGVRKGRLRWESFEFPSLSKSTRHSPNR